MTTNTTSSTEGLVVGPRPTPARTDLSVLTCTVCNGAGKLFLPTHDEECVCAKRIRIRDALPKDMQDIPMALRSPLCGGPDDLDTEGDLTTENVWLTAPPDVARAHIRWALSCRLFHLRNASRWSFAISSDETLRALFLAPANKFASKEEKDEAVPFDAHVQKPRLLIIRLGYLGHKNDAAAGILLTALKQREERGLPTWVVDSPSVPYAKGHLAWSERTEACLTERYRRAQWGSL